MRPVLSQQQQEKADRVALQAGLKGALIGVGLGAAATFFTYKRSPNFRALSRPMQSSFVVSGGTAGFLFGADRASTAYMNRVLGYMDEEMAAQRGRPNENLSKLSTKDRAIRYLNEHRWSVIGFSWVASMVGALGYTFSSKYLTTQQKVVQARMYAQAATIAVLLASAGLSIYSGEDRKKHSQCDEPDEQLRAVLNMPTTTQETQQTHQEQEKKVTGKNDHPEGKQRTTVDPPSQQEQQQRVASHKENLQSGSKQTANQGTDDAPEGKQRGYAEKLSSEEQLGRVASNKEDVWSSGKQLSNKQATSLETQGSNH